MKLALGPAGPDVLFYALSDAKVRFYVQAVLFLQIRKTFCTFFVTKPDLLF